MKKILKQILILIFNIETYEDLVIYLLEENEKLKIKIKELEDKNEIDLIEVCKEAGIDPDTLENIGA